LFHRLISSEEKCADLVKTVEESKAKLKDFKRLKRQLQEKNSNLERQHKMLTSENEVFREEKYTLMNKIVDLKSELEEVKEQAARSQVFSR
jgi:chromosome segregation ATPase